MPRACNSSWSAERVTGPGAGRDDLVELVVAGEALARREPARSGRSSQGASARQSASSAQAIAIHGRSPPLGRRPCGAITGSRFPRRRTGVRSPRRRAARWPAGAGSTRPARGRGAGPRPCVAVLEGGQQRRPGRSGATRRRCRRRTGRAGPVRPAGGGGEAEQRGGEVAEALDGQRAGLALQAARQQDDAGVDGPDPLVAEAHAGEGAGREALDEDVRPAHEVPDDVVRGRVGEIELDAELAGVAVGVQPAPFEREARRCRGGTGPPCGRRRDACGSRRGRRWRRSRRGAARRGARRPTR